MMGIFKLADRKTDYDSEQKQCDAARAKAEIAAKEMVPDALSKQACGLGEGVYREILREIAR